MTKGVLSAGLSVVLLAIAVAPAGAAPEVDVSNDKQSAFSQFSTSCPGENCRATLRIFDGARRIVLTRMTGDDGYAGHIYSWSCRRTGQLSWTVTITNAEPNDYQDDDPTNDEPDPTGVTRGTIRVPKCGKVQPRRVRRGYVAASAAEEYPDEFVSRSVCASSTALVRGKASTWRCIVVHNNTYRQCETIFRLRYTQQSKFGVIERKEHVKRERTRCASF